MSGCQTCVDYLIENFWNLMGACASVGIEHAKSTDQMMNEYMNAYHDKGHKE